MSRTVHAHVDSSKKISGQLHVSFENGCSKLSDTAHHRKCSAVLALRLYVATLEKLHPIAASSYLPRDCVGKHQTTSSTRKGSLCPCARVGIVKGAELKSFAHGCADRM
eukprot:5381374-Amphidinium_carterae.1